MKKVLFIAAICFCSIGAYSQTPKEPEFAGECMLLKSDNTTVSLEKQQAQTRTAMTVGKAITGIGGAKSKLQIDGCCAATKVSSADNIRFIVRAVDNNTDPMAIVKIFQFDSNKKYRRAELVSVNGLGTTKTNKLHYLTFTAEKFGKSSYLLTLQDKTPGEYGITVSNPNALDEKSVIVSSFSIE
ncbi:MAG: hypothetical protein LBE82_11455 [Chitinophagaceae bacterium]|jgi:hypothetical protein|nr:hypothetical protein [Chitinophagaceae bacterium]